MEVKLAISVAKMQTFFGFIGAGCPSKENKAAPGMIGCPQLHPITPFVLLTPKTSIACNIVQLLQAFGFLEGAYALLA